MSDNVRHLTIQYPGDESSGFTKRLDMLVEEGWEILNCGFSNKGYGASEVWWCILRYRNWEKEKKNV